MTFLLPDSRALAGKLAAPPLLICCLHWSLGHTLSPNLPIIMPQGTFYLLSTLHRTLDTLLHRQTPLFLSPSHILCEKDHSPSPKNCSLNICIWTGNIFLTEGMGHYWWIIRNRKKTGGLDSPAPSPHGTVLEALFHCAQAMSNSSKELQSRNPGHPCP